MISSAFKYVRDDLADFMHRQNPKRNSKEGGPPLVRLSLLMGQDGQFALTQDRALVMSVVSVQEEKVGGPGSTRSRMRFNRSGSFDRMGSYFDLNVYVLLAAFHKTAETEKGLKDLSLAIEFFQNKPSFNAQNSPGLPNGILVLNFEIYNLDFMQLSNLWSAVGAKLMPSVLYKARLQYASDGAIRGRTSAVAGRDNRVR